MFMGYSVIVLLIELNNDMNYILQYPRVNTKLSLVDCLKNIYLIKH